jgi:hypothetical protein
LQSANDEIVSVISKGYSRREIADKIHLAYQRIAVLDHPRSKAETLAAQLTHFSGNLEWLSKTEAENLLMMFDSVAGLLRQKIAGT